MLTDEQLAILKQINDSITFDGDERGETDKLVIEGCVQKDGNLSCHSTTARAMTQGLPIPTVITAYAERPASKQRDRLG